MKKIDLLYLIVVMFYLISGLIKWNITTIFACVLSLIFMVITNVIGKKLGFGNGIKILIYVFILGTDMQKDTVIRNINSMYLSHDIYVDKVIVNDIDFMERYGGYLDIGLYDTIGDMICTVVGSFMFIVIMKKRLNC